MKNNLIIKLFTIVVIFFLFATQSFAKVENNFISKVIIDSPTRNNFSLNLLFDKNYKGSAFLQKIETGAYYVYLPDTTTNGKRPQIIYNNKYDKSKIKLKIEEKSNSKDKTGLNYVRITVQMADDYPIKLISGLNSEYKTNLIVMKNIDYLGLTMLILLAISAFLIFKVMRKCKPTNNIYSTPSRSYEYLKSQTEYLDEIRRTGEEQVQRTIREKEISKNRIRQADKNSFDCFDIPYAEETNNSNNVEFHSTLNQASKLLKQKPSLVKLRHTNPITRADNKALAGFEMPAVEDMFPKKKVEKKSQNQPPQVEKHAELLSVLNITPNKGFYLTTVDDTFALFGFINENVFLFKKFNDLSQINLQARFYDKKGDNDVYIVRLDNYKAMIEISNTSMMELAKI
ncbi:MAG: hypothetical protein E7Z90_00265 [Cyanobacteria bacterium SIG29]|nr:hypothetical protein [Cyanobacteria bacterium SIG29]